VNSWDIPGTLMHVEAEVIAKDFESCVKFSFYPFTDVAK
jgi:hypothetical protein